MSEPGSQEITEGEKGENLARTAAKYIYNATMKFPGLASAEGLEIARLCKKTNNDPEFLKQALVQDEAQVQWLTDQGNKHHPKNEIKKVVVPDRMIAMIEGIFDYAVLAMGNTDQELVEALDQYPRYALVEGYMDEVKFGDEIMEPLAKARAERATQNPVDTSNSS